MVKIARYVILECTDTYNFAQWAKSKGWPIWIPVSPEWRTKKDGKREMVYRAAVPGYAFIQSSRWDAFRRAIPPCYSARPMGYDCNGYPHTCIGDQLEYMQQVILKDFDNRLSNYVEIAVTGSEIFKVGQTVTVIAGPFYGLTGTVTRVRNNKLRVLFGDKYINLPCALMKIVKK